MGTKHLGHSNKKCSLQGSKSYREQKRLPEKQKCLVGTSCRIKLSGQTTIKLSSQAEIKLSSQAAIQLNTQAEIKANRWTILQKIVFDQIIHIIHIQWNVICLTCDNQVFARHIAHFGILRYFGKVAPAV